MMGHRKLSAHFPSIEHVGMWIVILYAKDMIIQWALLWGKVPSRV